FRQKSTFLVFEALMKESLTPEQEAEAQQLADLIAAASRDDFLRLAGLLVGGGPAPFGDTEFKVRDTVLAIGARALETALRQKKRLRRLQRPLPALRPSGGLPRRAVAHPHEFVWAAPLSTWLLLLPQLRPGAVPLRRPGGHRPPPPHARCGVVDGFG